MKTTVLTNIFNEEYLLPFWLQHHKDMFDHGIILDYNSTDRSVEICKAICPTWEIRTTRNSHFEALSIDLEFMELEQTIEGVKVILNTTEFLLSERPIRDVFLGFPNPVCLSMTCYSPYSLEKKETPKDHSELFSNLLSEDVVFHKDRGIRQIHSFNHGYYTMGRHDTLHPKIPIEDMYVIWFGYYPLNEQLLKRKLQIQENIPPIELEKKRGYHHFYSLEDHFRINGDKIITGLPLKKMNWSLFFHIERMYQKKTFVVTGGCGFIGSHLVDKLCGLGHKVVVLDNLISGKTENLNSEALLEKIDIRDLEKVKETIKKYGQIDGIFHLAAITDESLCLKDPVLCFETNVMGSLNMMEVARLNKIKRIVLSSSPVACSNLSPYHSSKNCLEQIGIMYHTMFECPATVLRYSNAYGTRQPLSHVFETWKRQKKEKGILQIGGEGTQKFDFIHVSDIVEANLLAMYRPWFNGILDICTGVQTSLDEVAAFFECPVEYVKEERFPKNKAPQNPDLAFRFLGWRPIISLEEGMKEILL